MGRNDCCQPNVKGPCGLGEGDCDGDAECIEGLVCRECAAEFVVPGINTVWRIENAGFSPTDTCCRLPEDFIDS